MSDHNPAVALLPGPLQIFYQFLKIGGFFKGGGLKGTAITPEEEIRQALDQFQNPTGEGEVEGRVEVYLEIARKAAEIGDQSIIDSVLNAAPDQTIRDEAQALMPSGRTITDLNDAPGAGSVDNAITPEQELSKILDDLKNGVINQQIAIERVGELQKKTGATDQQVADAVGVPLPDWVQAKANPSGSTAVQKQTTFTIGDLSSQEGVGPVQFPNGSQGTDTLRGGTGNDTVGGTDTITGGGGNDTTTETEAQKNERILAEVRVAVGSGSEEDKKDAVNQVATKNGISLLVLGGIAGGLIIGAGLGGMFGSNAGVGTGTSTVSGGTGTDTVNGGGGNDTVNDEDDKTGITSFIPMIIAAAGSLVSGFLASKAAKDAADAQIKASEKALAVFEKNAGIATARLKETTTDALGTIRTGATTSADLINTSSQRAADITLLGGLTARDDVRASNRQVREDQIAAFNLRKQALDSSTAQGRTDLTDANRSVRADQEAAFQSQFESLSRGAEGARGALNAARTTARNDLLAAFKLQENEINSTAIASSKLIHAARETAAGNITKGFTDARGNIVSARDMSNSILQSSLATSTEKIDVARANAIAAQERGLKAIRSDYQPYLDAGRLTVENLEQLINNPQAQKDFILNNPFFDEIANQTERRLLAKQAASGRVGSGGTQLELRNRLLEIGNQLLDTAIGQRMGLVGVGANAAANVAQAELARSNAISEIEQQTGRSLAQLVEASATQRVNVLTNAGNNLANLNTAEGGALAGINTTAGRDLATIEQNRGTGIVDASGRSSSALTGIEMNTGANLANVETGLGRDVSAATGERVNRITDATLSTGEGLARLEAAKGQGISGAIGDSAMAISNAEFGTGGRLADIATSTGANLGNIFGTQGTNLANINTASTDAQARLQSSLGINEANILTGQAANTADVLLGQGNAQAAGIVGSTNAVTGGISNLSNLATSGNISGLLPGETEAQRRIRLGIN